MGRYERPPELAEALEFLSGGRYTILAGGTDFYPARATRPVTEDVLDVTGIDALQGYQRRARSLADRRARHLERFDCSTLAGALRRLQACGARSRRSPDPEYRHARRQSLQCLARRRRHAQSHRARRLGRTCRAARHAGRCRSPQFVTGNRQTARTDDEIVTAFLIPKPRGDARSTFVKLGARKYLVISIAMVAAVIEVEREPRHARGYRRRLVQRDCATPAGP